MKEDCLDHIEKEISKTPLYSLLGTDGIDELRHRIIDLICNEVDHDLQNNSYYLIDPDEINETLEKNIVQEAVEELKKEWKDRIKEYMSKRLEEMIK